MSDTVIKVENLFKEYRLGTIGHGTLRHDLASWWANVRGKDDPNSLITKSSTHPNPSLENRGAKKDIEELKTHFLALNDVSFEVKAGEVLGIIGRNGAGKSTLLKILSRVTTPTAGIIKTKGRMASLLEVGTGFHPELTGRENVYMNGAILGMRRHEIAKKMDEIIAFSELEKFIDTPVKRYSSGMYVKLAFSVAAHLDAEILILDEVLAVGDAQFQKKCLGKMDDVAKKLGKTVLFVSHNMASVSSLCNRAIFLEKGVKSHDSSDVRKVIREYYGENKENKLLQYYFNEKHEYQDIVRFIKYEVVDSQGQIVENILDGNDSYFINIYFDLKKYEENFVVFLAFYTESDDLIFVTDMYENNDLLIKGLQGERVITVKFPSEILVSANYKFSVGAVIHNQGWLLLPGDSKMSFSFINKITDRLVYSDSKHPMTATDRPGLIKYALNWKIR